MPAKLKPAEVAALLTIDDNARSRRIKRKLEAGQPLTKAERASLAAKAAPVPEQGILFDAHAAESLRTTAKTWDELAAALNVEERTLYNFRQKHAPEIHARTRAPVPVAQRLTRPDGTHLVAQWRKFADECGELKGRGLNNPESNAIDERQLRLRERLADVARAEHRLAEQTREVLPLTEYQDALRILVSAFDGALGQIPGRAAERIVEAARQAMLTLLRANVTPTQFTKLSVLLESPRCDHAAITQILESEIEAPRRVLAEADFLREEEAAPADTAEAV